MEDVGVKKRAKRNAVKYVVTQLYLPLGLYVINRIHVFFFVFFLPSFSLTTGELISPVNKSLDRVAPTSARRGQKAPASSCRAAAALAPHADLPPVNVHT